MKKLLLIVYFFAFAFLFITPLQAHAQDWGSCVDSSGVASLSCLPIVFGNIINAALIFIGSVALILFIYAGILFIRSGGDQKQVQTARQTITYAIIGLVVVLSSYAIINIISYTTGTACIGKISFTECNK